MTKKQLQHEFITFCKGAFKYFFFYAHLFKVLFAYLFIVSCCRRFESLLPRQPLPERGYGFVPTSVCLSTLNAIRNQELLCIMRQSQKNVQNGAIQSNKAKRPSVEMTLHTVWRHSQQAWRWKWKLWHALCWLALLTTSPCRRRGRMETRHAADHSGRKKGECTAPGM